MLTCVVPVKGNSERCSGKNLRQFKGIPLFEYKLKQLQRAGFDKIVVSSEVNWVLAIASDMGLIPHKRDPKYSTPSVPMSDVYRYIADEVEGDDIAWCNVTNPLVPREVYKMAIEDWEENKLQYDCLLSVCNLQKYIFWKGKPLNWDKYNHPKSQDLDGVVAQNFAINIRPRQDVIRDGCFEGINPYFFFMPELMSTKIDYEWQFKLCEANA